MKTTKILLIMIGVFSLSFVYPYSAVNLPDVVIQNKQAIVNIEYKPSSQINLVTDEKPRVIELEGVTVVDVFPPQSVECLQRQIKYPSFAHKEKIEGFVSVCMIFNRNGDIVIKDACSNSQELKNYIAEQLRNVHFKNCCMQMERDYFLRFNFKLL